MWIELPGGLQRLGEFFGERATGTTIAGLANTAALAAPWPQIRTLTGGGNRRRASCSRSSGCASSTSAPHRQAAFRLGRLRGIGAKQSVFEGRSIKTADDGVHLLRVGCVDEGEALRLLRFRIAYDLNRVRDKVLGAKPALDIVRSNPSRQIAQKDRKTHSMVVFNSIGRGIAPGGTMKALLCYHSPTRRYR